MKTLQVLSLCITISLFTSCTNESQPTISAEASESGALAMTVHAGTIGALAKTAAIEMSSLYIELSSPGLPTIYDSLTLSGGSAERTERKTYANLASRVRNNIVEWTLSVESHDQNGTIIHSGDTTFTVPPRDTIDIEMFLAAQYSMLVANFYPIRDSVTGCEIKVEGLSKNAVTFDKQSRLGDTVSLTDDYLPASQLGVSQNIEMNVYGHYFGVDTLLYTGDTSLSIISGQNSNYQIKLKYVGPAALQGAATMAVTLGAVGTITVDGELEDTVAMNEVVTDIDGNIYHTVTIGTQTWMVENLKVTRYNDGTEIPLVSDYAAWTALTTPGYCWSYNDSAAYSIPHGALYNWYVVDPNNPHQVAPTGWHVPNDSEFIALDNYLIANGYNYDGTTSRNKIAKAMAAKTGWIASTIVGSPGNDPASNNNSGFSAFASGYRTYDGGQFFHSTRTCLWWSITIYATVYAREYGLSWSYEFSSHGYIHKNSGLSVRCVKD